MFVLSVSRRTIAALDQLCRDLNTISQMTIILIVKFIKLDKYIPIF